MTENNIEYRNATVEDVDAFIELQKESGGYHEELDSRFRFAHAPDADDSRRDYFLKQCESDKAWTGLAFQNEKLVGYLKAWLQDRPPIFKERTRGFIEDLFVTSGARGQGIGSRLWDMALEWLKENEITRTRLWVAVRNPLALGFWEKKGFGELTRTMELNLE